jgi:hypothetical protein
MECATIDGCGTLDNLKDILARKYGCVASVHGQFQSALIVL